MEKLTIQNIDKLLGNIIEDRTLYKITDYNNSLSEPAYVFKFKEKLNGKHWNKEQSVHLMRIPKYNTNKYELFVMGLHVGTCIELELKDIQNIQHFNKCIGKVLKTARDWWDRTNKTN